MCVIVGAGVGLVSLLKWEVSPANFTALPFFLVLNKCDSYCFTWADSHTPDNSSIFRTWGELGRGRSEQKALIIKGKKSCIVRVRIEPQNRDRG